MSVGSPRFLTVAGQKVWEIRSSTNNSPFVNGKAAPEPEDVRYPRPLTRQETTRILRCCPHTVRKLELQGLLHPVQYNSRKFYLPDEVLKLMGRK
jgi:hypothetical protein